MARLRSQNKKLPDPSADPKLKRDRPAEEKKDAAEAITNSWDSDQPQVGDLQDPNAGFLMGYTQTFPDGTVCYSMEPIPGTTMVPGTEIPLFYFKDEMEDGEAVKRTVEDKDVAGI